MLCNRPMVQPLNTQTTNICNNNNYYTNNFNYTTYNRFTNINQTFINNENAQLSVNNNITVNNYGQMRQKSVCGQQQGFGQKIGQFLCGYRTPQVGCGCNQNRFGYGNYFGTNGSVRRFCSSITDKMRNFMNFRYSNV